MYKPDIISLLSLLGENKIKTTGDWVNSSCPLASISHEGGKDRHPSFGILINTKGESLYRCFTCSDAAPLSGLIHNLWLNKIRNWKQAMQMYGDTEVFKIATVSNGLSTKWDSIIEKEEEETIKIPVPDSVLYKFPLLSTSIGFEAERCRDFLSSKRGIDKKTQDLFSLRYCLKDRVIILPRIDGENKIWWLRARSRISKLFFSVSSSYIQEKEEENKWGDSSHLFGEQFLDFNSPVIIVESETDVLRLHTLGVYNVVATGGNVQKAQIDRLYNNVILLGFDADIPGLKNKIKATKLLKGYSTLFSLDWSILGITDAGKIETRADFDRVYNRKTLI